MPTPHPIERRQAAVRLVAGGARAADAARALGTSTATVYAWLHAEAPELVGRAPARCRCQDPRAWCADAGAYAQLLGLYLGDGCLSLGRTTWRLRITCDDRWPGVADEVAAVMAAVSQRRVQRVAQTGCHDVGVWWQHWPCLLPQHGPGKKHERSIVLEPWQRALVHEHPGRLLRGLFHSDGWRGHNVAVHRRPDGFVTRYRYPRYEFTNLSADIRGLCTDALDRLGIAWRPNGAVRISVNRREAVAALDVHVGPKS